MFDELKRVWRLTVDVCRVYRAYELLRDRFDSLP